MSKYLMSSVAAIAVLVAFTGCAKSTDMFDQGAIDERDRQEQERIDQQKETIVNQNYAAAFERAFGKVGSNVDWGFGRQPSRALTRGKNDYPSKGSLTADGTPSLKLLASQSSGKVIPSAVKLPFEG